MRYALNQIDNTTYEIVWEQAGYVRNLNLSTVTDRDLITDLKDPDRLEKFVKSLKEGVNDETSNDDSNYNAIKNTYVTDRTKYNNITVSRQLASFIDASYRNGTLTLTTMGGDTIDVTGFSSGGNGTAPITNIISTTDSDGLTNSTVNTMVTSAFIPANTINVGDIVYIKTRARKTGSAGTLIVRMYVNTSAALGGSLIATSGTNATSTAYFQYSRTLAIKSSTNTETMAGNFNVNPDDNIASSAGMSVNNIDWTQDQYLVIAHQNGNRGDTSLNSFYHIQILKA